MCSFLMLLTPDIHCQLLQTHKWGIYCDNINK